MCGIGGLLGVDPLRARAAAERMQAALRHRGPDDEGLALIEGPSGTPPAVLVHTRLSIVDTSPLGHQPMAEVPAPGALANTVTYNGEIYNFRELRAELASLGFRAHTGTDTEVLLQAYRAWGVRAVERFEGMFAFCLVDAAAGVAWLCRDRVGIKPLYVHLGDNGPLVFASEVRAVLAAGRELVTPRLSHAALEGFFAQGAVIGDDSIVAGVSLLGPGASLLVDFAGRILKRERYWSAAFGASPAPRARSELVGELGSALRRTVRGQLLADVPVGLFLSAGVDSTSVAVLAHEVSAEPLRTLAVGFDVPGYDETAEAELTAQQIGSQHRRIEISGRDILASFDQVLGATDQPTVDGFNTFCISRAAHESGLTVALSGVGGDELFGGYRTFSDVPRALRLRKAVDRLGPERLARLSASVDRLAGCHSLGLRARGLRKLSRLLEQPPDLAASYLLRRELFALRERRALQAVPPHCDPQTGLDLDCLATLRAAPGSEDPLDRIASMEFSMYLRHMLLRDADVFSMANRLELRVPLLEHTVVELAARAPGAWRRRDPRPKPLLLDAVGPRFPARAWRAKKRGFTLPWQSWLLGPLRERARTAIFEARWADAGIDARAAQGIWNAFSAGDGRVNALEILGMVVLESYLRRHALSA
ncbi:MAG TPA: asparagine synthase (glutamine-hydrolyzing) [Polyangiaceae bacterium]|nr:asparagine synthase (glutamine-hydrolyzing) [Polyangiaceae bacterium]